MRLRELANAAKNRDDSARSRASPSALNVCTGTITDWGEEDRKKALTYLASLVAETFNSGDGRSFSTEDVQSVLDNTKTDIASPTNGATRNATSPEMEGKQLARTQEEDTDNGEASEEEESLLHPSDIVVSQSWRKALLEKKSTSV